MGTASERNAAGSPRPRHQLPPPPRHVAGSDAGARAARSGGPKVAWRKRYGAFSRSASSGSPAVPARGRPAVPPAGAAFLPVPCYLCIYRWCGPQRQTLRRREHWTECVASIPSAIRVAAAPTKLASDSCRTFNREILRVNREPSGRQLCGQCPDRERRLNGGTRLRRRLGVPPTCRRW